MLFSKECILKRNSHFCLCILSQTLFSPLAFFSLSPPAPSCRSCRLHNWCKCCHMCQEWRILYSLLLCLTLSENIKWRKQPRARGVKSACQWSHSHSHCFRVVSSRWLRTKSAAANSSLCSRGLPHTLFICVAHPGLSSHLNTSLPNFQIFLPISPYLRYILSTSTMPYH